MTFNDKAQNIDGILPASTSQPALQEMFRSLIRKSYRDPLLQKPPETSSACSIVMNFDGAGSTLTPGMGGIPQMPQGAFRIVGCHMAAGIYNPLYSSLTPVTCSATVNIQLTTAGAWSGGATPIYDSMPSISGAEATIDITNWPILEIQPGDLLPFTLVTFIGTATVLTVSLSLRRLETTGLGQTDVISGFDTGLVDENGNPVVTR